MSLIEIIFELILEHILYLSFDKQNKSSQKTYFNI